MPLRIAQLAPTRLLFCLLALLVLASAFAQPTRLATLTHEDRARQYYLHVPEDLPAEAPLVVVLHGRGGTGPGMASLTGFDEVADRYGFVVAYPSGVQEQWNYVEGVQGYDLPVSDIGFLDVLVDDIASQVPVDRRRIYVAGFSNGGFMAQRLACDATGTFAAYASVGAAGFGGQPSVCEAPGPLSMLFIHGTHDTVVPFQGLRQETPGGPVTVLASVEETMTFWSDKVGCGDVVDSVAVPRSDQTADTQVSVLRYMDCPNDHELVLAVVLGGGHNWPGRAGILPENVAGNVNLDLNASEFIWQFFARHALP